MSATIGNLLLIALLAAATALLLLNHKSLDWRGLIFSQLLYLSAVFLSFRIVEEHWFIWILPHLTLLNQSSPSRRPWGIYSLSLTALIYSLVNSQILAFFTPAAATFPQISPAFTLLPAAFPQLRLPAMALTGTIFSIILVVRLFEIGKRSNWKMPRGKSKFKIITPENSH